MVAAGGQLTSSIRVLHVHTRYRDRGGEDSVVDAERRLLGRAGHQVVAVDVQNPTSPIRSAASFASAPWNEASARRVTSTARDFHPDVVHIHNTWFGLSPAVVQRLRGSGFPVVATFHNYRLTCANAMLFRDGGPCELCVGTSPWSGVRYACYRGSRVASLVSASTIALHCRLGTWSERLTLGIALTEFARSVLIRAGMPADKLVVKPNFAEDPGPRPNRPSESDEVLFVGRLSPEKGLEALLDMWERHQPSGLTLTVIGDGPLRGRVEGRDIEGLRFLGRLSHKDVRHRMLTGRALLFPSQWYEGQPMVLLEALAAGIPILFNDVGAVREIVGGGGLPVVGSGGEPGALEAVGEGELLDRLGVEGRRQFERHFSQVDAAGRLEAVYQRAIG